MIMTKSGIPEKGEIVGRKSQSPARIADNAV